MTWREKTVDAMPPVAAENPSGSFDPWKPKETRLRLPLTDEIVDDRFFGVTGMPGVLVLGAADDLGVAWLTGSASVGIITSYFGRYQLMRNRMLE